MYKCLTKYHMYKCLTRYHMYKCLTRYHMYVQMYSQDVAEAEKRYKKTLDKHSKIYRLASLKQD